MITFCPHCGTRVEERLLKGKPRPTCPACGHVAFADPKVAATVLVGSGEKLLLVRRAVDPARGLWCLPGGYVDYGEDPASAAVRECREEAGLDVDDLTLLDLAFNGRVIVITYTARLASMPEPVPGDDADLAAWFSPSALPPLAFANVAHAIGLWQQRRTLP